MGFTKWLFTKGVGSVGETARTWSKIFLDNYKGDVEESFESTLSVYRIALNAARNPHHNTYYNFLIIGSNKCLAIFIYYLVTEAVEVRKALSMNQRAFNIALEAIYEQVKATAPKFVVSTFQEFQLKAYQHINY